LRRLLQHQLRPLQYNMATPAGVRHNNPFDVSLPIHGLSDNGMGGGKIVGVSGQGGFAEFPTLAIGYAAGQHRIRDYIDVKGYNTIAKMGAHYATDPNWPHAVSKVAGDIGLNDILDTRNAAQMTRLEHAILTIELGPEWAGQVISQMTHITPPPPPLPQPKPQPTPGPIPMPISPQLLSAILQLAMMLINDLIAHHGGSLPIPLAPIPQQHTVPGMPPVPGATTAPGDFIQTMLNTFLPAMQQNFENNLLPQIEAIVAKQLASLNPTQPPK
jgi:hypothetical protein